MAVLSQFSKCLWCVWPALVIGIAWFVFYRPIDHKSYFGSLTVGKDPLAPEGQSEFESTRQRDGEKRRIIYWCAGIIAGGYLLVLVLSKTPIKALASPAFTATPSLTATATMTLTPVASLTRTIGPTLAFTTLTPLASITYAPTATARIIYQPGPVQVVTVVVDHEIPVVITQVVTVEVTRIITTTPLPTETSTLTPTATSSETETPTPSLTLTP